MGKRTEKEWLPEQGERTTLRVWRDHRKADPVWDQASRKKRTLAANAKIEIDVRLALQDSKRLSQNSGAAANERGRRTAIQ
jgi:hypothetical protein